jgi:protein involved in polysaccharide export with SLBB domain
LTITKSVSKEPSPEKIPPAPQAQSSSKAKVESSGTPLTITKSVSKEPSPEKIPPAPQAQSSSPAKAPEDLLHVSVWGNEELTNDVVVRPDGKISLPLVQDIQAEGFTASELADSIHRKLLPFIKGPNVSVIVRQINSPKFSVLGYVARPGTFPLRGDVTVLQALSEAGGFTPFASPKKIKLIRNADTF